MVKLIYFVILHGILRKKSKKYSKKCKSGLEISSLFVYISTINTGITRMFD